jgi:hypothetical protein
MSEQQSQKRGLASEGQKEQRARDSYAPIPPSNPVAGATGEIRSEVSTDEDLSLTLEEKRQRRQRNRVPQGEI